MQRMIAYLACVLLLTALLPLPAQAAAAAAAPEGAPPNNPLERAAADREEVVEAPRALLSVSNAAPDAAGIAAQALPPAPPAGANAVPPPPAPAGAAGAGAAGAAAAPAPAPAAAGNQPSPARAEAESFLAALKQQDGPSEPGLNLDLLRSFKARLGRARDAQDGAAPPATEAEQQTRRASRRLTRLLERLLSDGESAFAKAKAGKLTDADLDQLNRDEDDRPAAPKAKAPKPAGNEAYLNHYENPKTFHRGGRRRPAAAGAHDIVAPAPSVEETGAYEPFPGFDPTAPPPPGAVPAAIDPTLAPDADAVPGPAAVPVPVTVGAPDAAAVPVAVPAGGASLLQVSHEHIPEHELINTIDTILNLNDPARARGYRGQVNADGKLCPGCEQIVYNKDSPLSDHDHKLLKQQHQSYPIGNEVPLLAQRKLDRARAEVFRADQAKLKMLNKYAPADSLLQLSARN